MLVYKDANLEAVNGEFHDLFPAVNPAEYVMGMVSLSKSLLLMFSSICQLCIQFQEPGQIVRDPEQTLFCAFS